MKKLSKRKEVTNSVEAYASSCNCKCSCHCLLKLTFAMKNATSNNAGFSTLFAKR